MGALLIRTEDSLRIGTFAQFLKTCKWKLLGATQINSKHRIETMRKNKATLRRMGVEQSQLEKRTSANRVLERLARLFNNLAPTLGGWAKELSGILENRELRRVDHG